MLKSLLNPTLRKKNEFDIQKKLSLKGSVKASKKLVRIIEGPKYNEIQWSLTNFGKLFITVSKTLILKGKPDLF